MQPPLSSRLVFLPSTDMKSQTNPTFIYKVGIQDIEISIMSSSDEDIESDSDDAIENPIFEDESDESSDDDDGEEGNEDEEEDEEDQNDPEGALHRAALTKELWTACAEGDLARAEKAFVEGSIKK